MCKTLKNKLLLLAASAFSAGISVRADPLLSFGPDIPLFVTGSATVRRDDNVFLTDTNRKADTLYILDPGLDMHVNGSGGSASLTYDEQFIRYGTDKALNDHLATVAGRLAYHDATSQLTLSADYYQQDQSTLGSQNIDETLKHNQEDASVNGQWAVTAKTLLGAGFGFSRTMYPEAGLVDTDQWSIPVDYYYAVTPKVDLSIGDRFDRNVQDNGVGNNSDQFFNVGARGDFTPKLSGQIRVGVDVLKPQGGGSNTSEPGLGATLTYLATPRTTIQLSADNDFAESAAGTSEEVLSIAPTATVALGQAWSAILGGSLQQTKYLLTSPERKDKFWVGDFGLGYSFSTNTNVQLTYVFRTNSSTSASATFDDDILSLSGSSRF
jgi:hypothetical protein